MRRLAGMTRSAVLSALTRALVAAACVAAVAAPSAAAAQRGATAPLDEQVVLTGRVAVAAGESSGTVVIFDGPATIDGTVRGDVVVFNGAVDISGHVTRNVVAFNGAVTVRSGAQLDGDLVTRARPTIESGATVRGDLQRVNSIDVGTSVSFLGRLLVWIAMTVSLLVLGLLLLLFAPRAAEAVSATARERSGAAVAWGVALFLLLPIAALILLATLVGIPLGVGLLLALGLLYSIGYLASAYVLGRRILKPPSSRFGAFLLGWLILRVIALVPILGGLTWLAASVFGLGTLAVAARRSNRAGALEVAAPPPPPPPATSVA
jgi:hypothetical protein